MLGTVVPRSNLSFRLRRRSADDHCASDQRRLDPRVRSSTGFRRPSCSCLSRPLLGSHVRGLPPRPSDILPVGRRCRTRGLLCHPGPHRAVPGHTRGTGPGADHHRPAALDCLWLLPLRPHRRAYPLEPGPIRPAAADLSQRGAGHGPGRTRRLSLRFRALRPEPRCACRPVGTQRTAC